MPYSKTDDDTVPAAQSQEVVDEQRPTVAVATAAWSPAQIVGLIVGIFFAVLGAAALVRTGFDTAHIYTPHQSMWSFPLSPLLALIEIGYGALLVLASVVPGGLRWLMGLLGAIALVVGLVVVAENTPSRLNYWLGVTHRNGWLFVITGGVILLSALCSPVFVTGAQHRQVRHIQPVE